MQIRTFSCPKPLGGINKNYRLMSDKIDFNNNKVDKDLLIEHYKRIEAFWRHWTPTIWSIPTVASTINFGAYSLVFNNSFKIEDNVGILVFLILLFLNLALTMGILKHRDMQKKFGNRLIEIERVFSIEPINLKTNTIGRINSSVYYSIVMIIIFIANLGVLINLLINNYSC